MNENVKWYLAGGFQNIFCNSKPSTTFNFTSIYTESLDQVIWWQSKWFWK